MKRILYIALSLLVVSFAACQKDGPDTVDLGYLSLSSADARFTYIGGTREIVVKTSSTVTAVINWEGISEEWCSVIVRGNTVYVEAMENTGLESRSTYVTLSADGRQQQVAIIQTAFSFSVSTTSLDFTAPGGTKTVSFTAPSGFDVTAVSNNEDMATVTPVGRTMVTITVKPNSGEVRTTTIDLSAGNIKKSVTLIQAGSLSVDKDKLNFTYNDTAGQVVPFTVTVGDMELAATVDTDSQGWLTATVDNTAKTVTVTVTGNDDFPPKSGTITLTGTPAGGEEMTRTISVSQNGRPATVADVVGSYTGSFTSYWGDAGSMTMTITQKDDTTVTMKPTLIMQQGSVDLPAFDLTLDGVAHTLSFNNNIEANEKWELSGGTETRVTMINVFGGVTRLSITAVGAISCNFEWGYYLPDAANSDGSVGGALYIFANINTTRQ